VQALPAGPVLPALGAVLTVAGLGLAVWARRHLGREWSGLVTLKEGHRLIRTGPYRTVRHPIYSGLLLAVFGTALAIGQWRGVIAVVCNLIGLLRKVQVEETLMVRTFPEYREYRQRTAALIPGVY
jgi:protein-S-isoprenylcysteine O-methyltransferase Ste14